MAIKLSQRLPRFTPRNRRSETWHVCVWFPYFSPPSGCTIDVREVTNQRWLLPMNLILGEITFGRIADGISMIFHCRLISQNYSAYTMTSDSNHAFPLIKHRDQMCSVNSIPSTNLSSLCLDLLSKQTFSEQIAGKRDDVYGGLYKRCVRLRFRHTSTHNMLRWKTYDLIMNPTQCITWMDITIGWLSHTT